MSFRSVNEHPELVPLVIDLVDNGSIAVWVTAIQAYSTWFEFDLLIRKRSPAGGNIDSFGFGRPNPRGLVDHLLFGMEFADGFKMSNVSTSTSGGLKVLSGSGGPQASATRFFCPRIPSDGLTTFYTAWPSFGINETSHQVDTSQIRDASAKSRILWPPQTDTSTPEQASSTEASALGGWFESLTLGPSR